MAQQASVQVLQAAVTLRHASNRFTFCQQTCHFLVSPLSLPLSHKLPYALLYVLISGRFLVVGSKAFKCWVGCAQALAPAPLQGWCQILHKSPLLPAKLVHLRQCLLPGALAHKSCSHGFLGPLPFQSCQALLFGGASWPRIFSGLLCFGSLPATVPEDGTAAFFAFVPLSASSSARASPALPSCLWKSQLPLHPLCTFQPPLLQLLPLCPFSLLFCKCSWQQPLLCPGQAAPLQVTFSSPRRAGLRAEQKAVTSSAWPQGLLLRHCF